MEQPQHYLPLFRWAEAAGSLPVDRQITHPWRWAMNLALVVSGWIWQLFKWLGSMAVNTSSQFEYPDDITDVITDISEPLAPIILAGTIAVFIWNMARKKETARLGLRHLAMSALFVFAASMTAVLELPQRIIDTADGLIVGTAAPALNYVSDQISDMSDRNTRTDITAAEDPLGCASYIFELDRRSNDAHPLPRTLDTWMRWMHLPNWVDASYGSTSSYQGERMYCRSLETTAGISSLEQAEVTVCAYGEAVGIPASDDGSCSDAHRALSLPEGHPGPFRQRSQMSYGDHYPQEAAWVMCTSPPLTQGGQWGLNPGVWGYEIETAGKVSGTASSTETLHNINGEHEICRQWFTGNSGFGGGVHVCPPWSGDNVACWRPANSITSNSEPATDVKPTRNVFKLRANTVENWNTSEPQPGYEQEWDDVRSWVSVRSSGGGGVGDLLGLLAGLFGAATLVPIVVGLAGGIVVSQVAIAVLLAVVPLVLLAGVSRRVRLKALKSLLKVALLFAAAKVMLLWALALYSLLFWLIGRAAWDGLVWEAMWTALTPTLASLVVFWLSRIKAVRKVFGGADISSTRGLLSLGAGAAMSDQVSSIKTAKRYGKSGAVRAWGLTKRGAVGTYRAADKYSRQSRDFIDRHWEEGKQLRKEQDGSVPTGHGSPRFKPKTENRDQTRKQKPAPPKRPTKQTDSGAPGQTSKQPPRRPAAGPPRRRL